MEYLGDNRKTILRTSWWRLDGTIKITTISKKGDELSAIITKPQAKALIEELQKGINKQDKEMDCKQEERLEKLENEKVKPIVTVVVPLLRKDYILVDLRKELGDEYHVIPVLNHQAIQSPVGIISNVDNWRRPIMMPPGRPELKAVDFPCLNYYAGSLQYCDGDYIYEMTNTQRRAAKLSVIGRSPEWIDRYIDIVECQLSDIKPGDYFFLKVPGAEPRCENYRYCTHVDYNTDLMMFDCGFGGYIRSEAMGINTKNEHECLFVKFTLK